MGKYGAEAQEKAYELFMMQRKPFQEVMRQMKAEFPSFSKGTLTKWINDKGLDWSGRYRKYCDALAEKNDAVRVKAITPMITAVQDIREETYKQIMKILEKTNEKEETLVSEKNLANVLKAFAELAQIELRMTGSGSRTPVNQVINVIFMVIENDPNIGPVFKQYKNKLQSAIIAEIEGE